MTTSASSSTARPLRQGFYEVTLADGRKLIGEWREATKGGEKVWWEHLSETPTSEKKRVRLVGVVAFEKASPAAAQAALKRELTAEEKLQVSYESFKNMEALDSPSSDLPPPNRILKVGDMLEVGNLKDCKVEKLWENGRVVTFSYHALENHYGRMVDNGRQLHTFVWTDVVPALPRTPTQRVRMGRLEGAFTTTMLDSLLRLPQRGLVDNPDYQRDYVWTEEDQQRYLDSVFEGRDLGRFILVRHKYPKPEEILDGKQRLRCLTLFRQSRLAWRGVYWHELNRLERGQIENRSVQVARLESEKFSRADCLRVFLEVNAGGVPQSEEHITHVKQLLAAEESK